MSLEQVESRSEIEDVLAAKPRRRVSRRRQALWLPPPDRQDPVATLEAQAAGRLPDLVPIRYGRMLESPFTFLRGSADVMARDLASQPDSGIIVQLCGDAHLSNFGLFASPERNLSFGLNDFDETAPGPFEWDVKRLATSVAVVATELGFSPAGRRAAAGAVGQGYQRCLSEFAAMRELDLWYYQLQEPQIMALAKRARVNVEKLQKVLSTAKRNTSLRAYSRLATRIDGRPAIKPSPPLIVPIPPAEVERIARTYEDYAAAAPVEQRPILQRYRLRDAALKVVGVGSVGTRCWVALLTGRDDDDPLFLQVKEASDSVLPPVEGTLRPANNGERVVAGQKLLQSTSDIFLGWTSDREGRGYYIRQLWDMKGGLDPMAMMPVGLATYGAACARELARAHARTGNRAAIAAYVGAGGRFAWAIERFAEAYARQTVSDHAALLAAERSGRIEAARGV